MIAPILAAAALLLFGVGLGEWSLSRDPQCEPFAEVCRGSVIYTCDARGRWVRGIDCARSGRRDRVTVCEVEPGGAAVCVESGGARPWP